MKTPLRSMVLAMALVLPTGAAVAHEGDHALQQRVGYDQMIGDRVPADLAFRDSTGREIRFGDLLDGRPVILATAWYSCANLCPILLRNLAMALRQSGFRPGEDFTVVTASIDPREAAPDAAAVRAAMIEAYGGATQRTTGWRALTGDRPAIDTLAQAIGFRYAYDERRQEYAHPAGIVVIDGSGTISRYLFGMDYAARDLRLALVEAGRGEIGSPVDQLVLRCHTFDPLTGQYSLAVTMLLNVSAGATVLALGGVVGRWLLRDHRRNTRPRR